MEKSNIKSIDTNYLNSIGFKGNQINQIYDLIYHKYTLNLIYLDYF